MAATASATALEGDDAASAVKSLSPSFDGTPEAGSRSTFTKIEFEGSLILGS